jgi:anti-sigma regulatory factor (Ser/Thr protein kinase)
VKLKVLFRGGGVDNSKITINLPSLRDDSNGYRYLFKLLSQVREFPELSYDMNFKNCSRIDQNGVAVLGAIARFLDADSRDSRSFFKRLTLPKGGVMFQVDSMSSLIRDELIGNNFLSHFTQEHFYGYPVGDYIGYREHLEILDPNEIADHLSYQWLSDEKISISEKLKSAIVSRIFEIFMNAYGHGSQKVDRGWPGVISCGQYDSKEGQLKLSVIDLGPGIIENVCEYHSTRLSGKLAMEWALESGNSTRTDSPDDIPRGLGFGLLREFATVNQGELKIYSNTHCATIKNGQGYVVEKMKTSLDGTMVSITINCDNRHYALISELSSETEYF